MLLVHDLNDEDSKEIIPLLPSESKILSREINNIKGCIGCFNCWIKTPGRCIIEDSYTEMPKYILEGGTFVIITKIKYGCYTSYVKNVIDRSIGFLLPFFQTVNGELHHLPRYNNDNLRFIVIGYGDDVTSEEEQTFKDLIKGNATNLCFSDYKAYVVKTPSDIKTIIKSL
ncbi:flavodoxin family protein [Clostridium chromiireducens]|uniref:Flavodoxin family protein n=1 Tax=Clostridium chromiireducens TaxID=225345 RepID=A0A964RLE7_9CLOT|nr:flavodoxin family protein [Clostridium chromiireducens]MVX63814.1 flavodoxin family protein [Clostridium chromiireducens]